MPTGKNIDNIASSSFETNKILLAHSTIMVKGMKKQQLQGNTSTASTDDYSMLPFVELDSEGKDTRLKSLKEIDEFEGKLKNQNLPVKEQFASNY